MKILLPIKRVPDPYGRVRLRPDNTLDTDDIKWVINPFDEIAIEEAVRMRENGIEAELTAVTIGPEEWQDQLRAALAMGCDRAIHIVDDKPHDARSVSHLLAAVADTEKPDLILMGKQAIDDDFSQTGPMLAARLGWPQATFASKITLAAGAAEVEREVDAGRETVRVTLPAVITTDLRLNEPRYVALPAIVRARSKPLTKAAPSDFGGRTDAAVTVLSLLSPPPRKAGRRVSDVDELISALREEAKVIG